MWNPPPNTHDNAHNAILGNHAKAMMHMRMRDPVFMCIVLNMVTMLE